MCSSFSEFCLLTTHVLCVASFRRYLTFAFSWKILISDSCHTVLVQRLPEHGPVHEALIEDRGKSTIYLRFSSQAVKDFKLVADDTFTVRAQFRQNRVPYCEWHYSVDKVRDCRLVDIR